MHAIGGRCYCGNIRVELGLTRGVGEYRPRACDCGFCRKHGAAYLSDPGGWVRIQVDDPGGCAIYQQGNELAEMLLCARCGVLVGALYRSDGRVYATVNVKVIEGDSVLGAEEPVSPKQLSAEDKVSRWKKLWFSDVRLGGF